jgi:hypothetical protein
METKYYQGKSKQNHDAAEFMAFVGVVGLGLTFLMYFTYLLIFINN